MNKDKAIDVMVRLATAANALHTAVMLAADADIGMETIKDLQTAFGLTRNAHASLEQQIGVRGGDK